MVQSGGGGDWPNVGGVGWQYLKLGALLCRQQCTVMPVYVLDAFRNIEIVQIVIQKL